MNKGRRFLILSFKTSCTDRCKTTKPCNGLITNPGRFYWKSPRFTDLFTPDGKQFLEINYGAVNYVVLMDYLLDLLYLTKLFLSQIVILDKRNSKIKAPNRAVIMLRWKNTKAFCMVDFLIGDSFELVWTKIGK